MSLYVGQQINDPEAEGDFEGLTPFSQITDDLVSHWHAFLERVGLRHKVDDDVKADVNANLGARQDAVGVPLKVQVSAVYT